MNIDEITQVVIEDSIKIHRDLGPGLMESVYESILCSSLERRGLKTERQKTVRFEYDGMTFDEGMRIDLLVESRLVIELKSVEKLAPVHGKQLLTYLRLMDVQVGLLINFGSATLREGLRRVVNRLPATPTSLLRVNRKNMP